MKTIAIFSGYYLPHLGGVERYTYNLAKNLKEASQWSSVLMIFIMMFGITSLMGMGNIPTNPIIYLIPVYNSVQCMASIFSMSFNGLNFMITILSNILYIFLGVLLLAKMFNSEKIMSSN